MNNQTTFSLLSPLPILRHTKSKGTASARSSLFRDILFVLCWDGFCENPPITKDGDQADCIVIFCVKILCLLGNFS